MTRGRTLAASGTALGLAVSLAASCSPKYTDDSTGSTNIRVNRVAASVVAKYPRKIYPTIYRDPVTLDVCSITGATVPPSGVRLTLPAVADAAGCMLTARAGSGATAAAPTTAAVALQPSGDSGPAPSGLRGQSAAAPAAAAYDYPFDDAQSSCSRGLRVSQPGLFTAWTQVAVAATTGRESQACDLAGRLRDRFVTVTGSRSAIATLPRLSTSRISVLALDTCKVATAGRVGAAIDATGAEVVTAFGAGCLLTSDVGTVELLPGVVRAGARVSGSPRVVERRRLVLLPSDAPRCSVVAQLGREAVTARFTGSNKTTPADCGVAADALVAYLNALDPR